MDANIFFSLCFSSVCITAHKYKCGLFLSKDLIYILGHHNKCVHLPFSVACMTI